MSIILCSTCKDGVERDLSLDSECLEDPEENNSTEKLASPHKDGIHLFLHRAQKTVENGFLRCCCCCYQDSVECFVPEPLKPHYESLESPEAQSEEAKHDTDITCISEQRIIESLSLQSSSNSSSMCSDFVLPGEVPIETTGVSDSPSRHYITTLDTTSIAEDNVEKKSPKHISWKKTRSLIRRARKAIKLPLLCSTVDVVERFRLSDSPEAQCGDSTQTLDLDEPNYGMLETMEPDEVLFQPTESLGMEASLLEISSAKKPSDCTKKEIISNYLKKSWKGWE
ncbi:uncharacterized protein [Pseudorasbora parva]|uniref:uncharacterized protein n=1 Tax=Pseudorasbora parva TaxID=51549 RepID=UPI00351E83F9